MIKLPILSDDKLAEVAVVCWPALEEHERRSFQLIAEAQRLSDLGWFAELLEHWEDDSSDLSSPEAFIAAGRGHLWPYAEILRKKLAELEG